MEKLRGYKDLFRIVFIVLLLDQPIKYLVHFNLDLGETWLPAGMEWLSPYARIVHWYNTGAAFGSFQGDFGWVFTLIALVVTSFILYYYPQIPDEDRWMRIAMGLLVGGALGNNLFDRLLVGHVIDFISVGNFWVFNVADVSINASVAVMFLGMVKKTREEQIKAGEAPDLGGSLKHLKNYLILFLVAGTVIALDQWTKGLVRTNLALGGVWLPEGMFWLAPYARIVHWYNTGAAFGSFQGYSWVFTILAFVVVALIIYYYPQVGAEVWWLRLAMGMQMGGALGNVIDRLLFEGKVTDFISVGNFPVFNIADSSITVGVIILLIGTWVKETQEKKEIAKQDAAEGEERQDAPQAPDSSPVTEEGSGE